MYTMKWESVESDDSYFLLELFDDDENDHGHIEAIYDHDDDKGVSLWIESLQIDDKTKARRDVVTELFSVLQAEIRKSGVKRIFFGANAQQKTDLEKLIKLYSRFAHTPTQSDLPKDYNVSKESRLFMLDLDKFNEYADHLKSQ